MTTKIKKLSEAYFCDRFVKHMISTAGKAFSDGTSIEDYAQSIAPIYYEDVSYRDEGPEECADRDMSYWEGEYQ